MSYKKTRDILSKLIDENYEDYIKAIFSLENNIEDEKELNELYQFYMESYHCTFLHEDFIKEYDIN